MEGLFVIYNFLYKTPHCGVLLCFFLFSCIMKNMKQFIIGLSFVLVLIAVGFAVGSRQANISPLYQRVEKTDQIDQPDQLRIADKTLSLHVAVTPVERSQGLSGFSSLKKDEGMLFVFEELGYYGFWMKEMKFPIDIIWLSSQASLSELEGSSNGDLENVVQIVHIEHNLSPASFPEVFQPLSVAQYVLEVNAGFSTQNNLEVGDQVTFLP